jgi:5-methylcytosine-specific restriction endonuclease McrA
MSKPPRLCTCGKIVAYGVQCECQKAATRIRNARFDSTRPSARARGYNSEWRKARLAYLITHPYCCQCREAGFDRTATVVDHVTPHKGNDRLFWDRTNWQPLCQHHHNSTKQRQERST